MPEATLDDLLWADGLMFGTPTRYGLPTSQLKQFIDTTGGLWAEGKLVNKTATSFTSTATAHGGHETTIVALNNTFYHRGCVLVPPGYADENQMQAGTPYGATHVAREGRPLRGDVEVTSVRFQAERLVQITRALKTGLAAQERELATATRARA
ncbi:NAD(P)H-dependent oxidoreductase [Allorhizocola rhizosphaerae]|uniref:NAD(P)H-dependent oxidoreductase n=1 Tax=Allorhizocola rhizosphaerae TaxID=1872709 RepID=UPI000E3EC9BE|nr:NAD(P)H-dependent oxidoreductase [Allorhizocola rhizosphaerae]